MKMNKIHSISLHLSRSVAITLSYMPIVVALT